MTRAEIDRLKVAHYDLAKQMVAKQKEFQTLQRQAAELEQQIERAESDQTHYEVQWESVPK